MEVSDLDRLSERLPRGWLIAIFAFALFVRWAVATHRLDLVWPDEHFQTLEPAGKLVFGHGLLPWEWTEGYRSWIVPAAVFAPILWLCKAAGWVGGEEVLWVPRAVLAIFSACVLFSLARLMEQWRVSRWGTTLTLLAFAFLPATVLWSVTTLTDHLALLSLWLAFPFALGRVGRGDSRSLLLAGLSIGLVFLMRPQMLLAQLAFVLGVALFELKARRRLYGLIWGMAIPFAVSGAVDWATWGTPFHSLRMQVFNGFEKSKFYGISPWYDYLKRIPEDQGLLWVALALLAVLGGWGLRARRRSPASFPPSWKVIHFTLLALFLGFSAIAHKETRFLLPVFPIFAVWLGWGLDPLLKGIAFFQKPSLRHSVLLALALPVLAYFSLKASLSRPLYLSSVDISKLEAGVFMDLRAHGKNPGEILRCVLTVDHNWSWTRGQLVLGAPAERLDRKGEEVTPADLARCPYVISPLAPRGAWVSLGLTQNRWSLWRRADLF